MNNTQVIILGTPRSGTSMLAHICRLLGVYMGGWFSTLDQNNPGGSLEDMEAREITHGITGGAHHALPGRVLSEDEDQAMRDFIAKRDTEHAVWGFKDCHTVWLGWQWHARLSNPRYIWVERRPADVLVSWERTWGFDVVAAVIYMNSWAAAHQAFLSDRPHLHVSYEDMLRSKNVEAIAEFIGLPDAYLEAARAWIQDDVRERA